MLERLAIAVDRFDIPSRRQRNQAERPMRIRQVGLQLERTVARRGGGIVPTKVLKREAESDVDDEIKRIEFDDFRVSAKRIERYTCILEVRAKPGIGSDEVRVEYDRLFEILLRRIRSQQLRLQNAAGRVQFRQ